MDKQIAAAVFNDCDSAERAVRELKQAGVPENAISVIELHSGETEAHDGGGHRTEIEDDHDNKGTGALKGLLAGGTLGALAGVGALLIPGVGPFIAGGALAQTLGAAGSAAVASGALGAAAGGLTGVLADYGVDRSHAEYYETKIREGGVFVAVDTSDHPQAYDPARAILRAAGGESAEAETADHA